MRLLLLAALAGCASSRPSAPVVPVPSNEAPAVALPRGEGDVLLRGAADLDGDGRAEEITVTGDGLTVGEPYPRIDVTVGCPDVDGCRATLRVGAARTELVVAKAETGGFSMQIIDIDPMDRRRELLLTRRGADGEDPWYEFAVVVHDGRALHVTELWHSSGYNSGTARAGGGALVLEYDECPDRTTVVHRLQGTRVVEVDRKVERVREPDTCAACPYVYVRAPDGAFELRGEILRNVNRKAIEQTQHLGIGPVDGEVTIELREEKDEVTFLDDVYLEVDGARIDPRGEAWAADGAYTVLRKGDVLHLVFDAPAGDARLVATGYYEPVVTRASTTASSAGDPP